MKWLGDRDELELASLAEAIASREHDLMKVQAELTGLATALRIPPGKLRPDDIIEEIAGRDFAAGDALLEIEVRLEKSSKGKQLADRLTVRDVISQLAR